MLVQTNDLMRDLVRVQHRVNARWQYVDNYEQYLRDDIWDVLAGGSESTDYVTVKRRALGLLGHPVQELRPILCTEETGKNHVILSVDVKPFAAARAHETYVLDSRFPSVLTWSFLHFKGYRGHKRQAPDGRSWVEI